MLSSKFSFKVAWLIAFSVAASTASADCPVSKRDARDGVIVWYTDGTAALLKLRDDGTMLEAFFEDPDGPQTYYSIVENGYFTVEEGAIEQSSQGSETPDRITWTGEAPPLEPGMQAVETWGSIALGDEYEVKTYEVEIKVEETSIVYFEECQYQSIKVMLWMTDTRKDRETDEPAVEVKSLAYIPQLGVTIHGAPVLMFDDGRMRIFDYRPYAITKQNPQE